MKKTLAIVLALAMVLCMMPAAFANTTKTITDKSYNLTVQSVGTDLINASATSANSITANYYYEDEESDVTGKFTEDKKMALVSVSGFDSALPATADDITITIDGKELEINSNADYYGQCGWISQGTVVFPVELTKSGYSDTYLITVSGTGDGDVDITETAKITVKFVNKSSYKNALTATISKISGDGVSAYIVGSKIYLDYAASTANDNATVDLTFKDENGSLFSVVTWAYSATSDKGTNISIFETSDSYSGVKLDDSVATYKVIAAGKGTGDYISDVYFTLETASAIYETKEYDVVVRNDIYETDPKGIYFTESSKTIAIGESYTPVVMGVATGKAVDATIDYGTAYNTTSYVNAQYIDIEDGDTIIGTQEGVSYVTASYAFTSANNVTTTYTAASMKITVSGTAEVATSTTMVVSCRALNVRKGPGTSYAKTKLIYRGTSVEVVSVANGWAKLSDGTYVCYKYLTK